MEPRIQYAQTKDGVSIAFWTLGEGMPLVLTHGLGGSHIELEWQWPELPWFYQRLAEKRTLVRFDLRGFGLSERDVTAFSVDLVALDLQAVADRLSLERFALFATVNMGPSAVAYAARNPERVSHLLLWTTYASYAELSRSPQVEATRSLIERDWALYTETVAHAMVGWSEGEAARWLATWTRESATPEVMQTALAATREIDVVSLLPQVRAPTLVLHRRQYALLDVHVARNLASRIPNARLALLEGTSVAPWLGDTEAVLTAIDEFLGEGEQAADKQPAVGDVHTILFTDMERSTALTQRLGDAKAQELVRTHNAIVREALKAHGGSEIKHTGDGIMASFPAASHALECAIAIQQAVQERAAVSDQLSALRIRIGLNAGEPVAEERDLFGTAVQLAARICDRAEAGEILASDVVRQLAAGKGFLFSDRGDVALRGFEDPVRLYEVRWQEEV